MTKRWIFGVVILAILLLGPVKVSGQSFSSENEVSLHCGSFNLTGSWDEIRGLGWNLRGECVILLPNPTNESIEYYDAYWYNLSLRPENVRFNYYFSTLPEVWITPGGTINHSMVIEGRVDSLSALIRLIREEKVLIRGRGNLIARTKENTQQIHVPIRANVSAPVEFDWVSVVLVLTARILPFLWLILPMSVTIAASKSEGKSLGWGILATYGIVVVPFLGLLSNVSLKTQLIAVIAIELLLLAVWISILNRTTPNKPEKVTKFLGNAVILFLGFSIFTAIAGAYVEGSSVVAGGVLFLILILLGASYYFIGNFVGEEEKKGRTPKIYTPPFGMGLFLFAYPTIVALLVAGWISASITVVSTAVLLFLIGLKLEKAARKAESADQSV
ncbi:MAG: hypothetical protein PWQ79_297 [Thermococcaceae archaeon]|nr:hypothetical protein [Thermococcaceae archaeon]MDK2913382.1 hypothetical protein [Thermococcaceae archaeon]